MGLLCNSFTNKVAGLQSIDKLAESKVFDKDTFQQTFVGLQEKLFSNQNKRNNNNNDNNNNNNDNDNNLESVFNVDVLGTGFA